jgi:hypothetical protein
MQVYSLYPESKQDILYHFICNDIESKRNVENNHGIPTRNFLIEFKTLFLNNGRQTGKTTCVAKYIKNNQSEKHLYFCHNDSSCRMFKQRHNIGGNALCVGASQFNLEELTLYGPFDNVFVDNYSLIKKYRDKIDMYLERIYFENKKLVIVKIG